MEATETQELHEQHKHGEHDPSLRPVSFTMSVFAVVVAIVTVQGHRTHTAAVLAQARASDQWNLYQAKKIRDTDTALALDLLSTLTVRDAAGAARLTQIYKSHREKWAGDLEEEQRQAREIEDEVHRAEHRASRFDLGEALLEIGPVVTSITLLTRQRIYWAQGMVVGVAGLVVALAGWLL